MKRSAAVAVATRDAPPADQLLRFAMKPYQPRAAPLPAAAREPPVPQSIKDAIVRWLDEQL